MNETERQTRAYLRLVLTPGLGIRSCHRILGVVHDPVALAGLKPADLTTLGVESDVAHSLLSARTGAAADAEWDRAATLGIDIIDLGSPVYPKLLLETPDPPLVLYIRGRLPGPDHAPIAIVGSRRASGYGLNCAVALARDLARGGAVIVSGLARGIDTAAHRGALESGTTVAVLGCGVDRTYPRENAKLAESIVDKGAILSEFPLGTPPLRDHFPRRNRILAGMTLGTVVVEAASRSGSLITARMALEADREVFAVPGPIHAETSRGPHRLIRLGACLVRSADDVIEELPDAFKQWGAGEDGTEGGAAPGVTLSEGARRLERIMSRSDPIPADLLAVRLDRPVAEFYEALLELELAGRIRTLPGDRYLLGT